MPGLRKHNSDKLERDVNVAKNQGKAREELAGLPKGTEGRQGPAEQIGAGTRLVEGPGRPVSRCMSPGPNSSAGARGIATVEGGAEFKGACHSDGFFPVGHIRVSQQPPAHLARR